jgi:Cof subfamily protein (haloacid dehalogenase superfamily)
MIKLLVTDLDGTLLDQFKSVDPRNKAAIEAIMASGVDVCLASARTLREIQYVATSFNDRLYAISQNGAFVHTKDHEELKKSEIDKKIALNILSVASQFSVAQFVACHDHTIHTPLQTTEYQIIKPRMFVPCLENSNLFDAISNGLMASKFSFYGDIKVLQKLQSTLQHLFSDDINAEISDSDCLDVMAKGVSKGNALQLLMEWMGITDEEVACIGDSFNDVSMFHSCAHSFAMKASQEAVRIEARYIVSLVADAVLWIAKHNAPNSIPNHILLKGGC